MNHNHPQIHWTFQTAIFFARLTARIAKQVLVSYCMVPLIIGLIYKAIIDLASTEQYSQHTSVLLFWNELQNGVNLTQTYGITLPDKTYNLALGYFVGKVSEWQLNAFDSQFAAKLSLAEKARIINRAIYQIQYVESEIASRVIMHMQLICTVLVLWLIKTLFVKNFPLRHDGEPNAQLIGHSEENIPGQLPQYGPNQ